MSQQLFKVLRSLRVNRRLKCIFKLGVESVLGVPLHDTDGFHQRPGIFAQTENKVGSHRLTVIPARRPNGTENHFEAGMSQKYDLIQNIT